MRLSNLRNRLRRWQRTFHTIRHLQPRQAWYFFLRRGIGACRVPASTGDIARRQIELNSILKFEHSHHIFSSYEFNFLNRTLSFPRHAMNWCPTEAQRLWRYNLHYFDFLRDPARPLLQKCELIDDWIANNPQGLEPAWEPYTASLRIVNWCLFFWSLPQAQIADAWLHSLHLQMHWLERNLELHILANHYFENIKAMLFASLFFRDRDSNQWLRRFQQELVEQLREQTLSDGGHYERSPQYHCILLEDYLDLYALLSGNSSLVESTTLSVLAQTIDAGLRFLAAIATPDDDIPLFNDSASGSAAKPSTLFSKARQLSFQIDTQPSMLIDFPDSGLFGWKCGDDYFLIDCGNIGPAYQPGHTHCDFLSYVLMIDKQWIIVDSGVCEYEPGEMRSYVRSTAAHNTLSIDNAEQSEVWGEFRVGRRARSLGASIKREENTIVFEGAYRGFPALGNIVHRRRVVINIAPAGAIQNIDVSDTVQGNKKTPHPVKTQVHLHPSLSIEVTGGTASQAQCIEIHLGAAVVAVLSGSEVFTQAVEPSWFCPEFGLKKSNIALQMGALSQFPVNFSYKLRARRSLPLPASDACWPTD